MSLEVVECPAFVDVVIPAFDFTDSFETIIPNNVPIQLVGTDGEFVIVENRSVGKQTETENYGAVVIPQPMKYASVEFVGVVSAKFCADRYRWEIKTHRTQQLAVLSGLIAKKRIEGTEINVDLLKSKKTVAAPVAVASLGWADMQDDEEFPTVSTATTLSVAAPVIRHSRIDRAETVVRQRTTIVRGKSTVIASIVKFMGQFRAIRNGNRVRCTSGEFCGKPSCTFVGHASDEMLTEFFSKYDTTKALSKKLMTLKTEEIVELFVDMVTYGKDEICPEERDALVKYISRTGSADEFGASSMICTASNCEYDHIRRRVCKYPIEECGDRCFRRHY